MSHGSDNSQGHNDVNDNDVNDDRGADLADHDANGHDANDDHGVDPAGHELNDHDAGVADLFRADAIDGNPLQDGTFTFTMTGGRVTAEQAVFGDHTSNVHIPTGATFAVAAGAITETIVGPNATQTITFTAEASNPSLFQVTSEAATVTTPATVNAAGNVDGFQFPVTAGTVTAEQEVFGLTAAAEQTHAVAIPPDAQFTVGATSIIETVVQGHEIDVTTFTQPGGTGLFAVVSEANTIIPQGAAATALDIVPFDRDEFTFSGAGAVTGVSKVSADGTAHAAAADHHLAFTQLAPGFVLETDTRGHDGGFEVFHDGNGDGIFTLVAQGEGTSVDLAGLQAQLTTVDPFL